LNEPVPAGTIPGGRSEGIADMVDCMRGSAPVLAEFFFFDFFFFFCLSTFGGMFGFVG
jgi:hypothetical protein